MTNPIRAFIEQSGVTAVLAVVFALALRSLYDCIVGPILALIFQVVDLDGFYAVLSGDVPLGLRYDVAAQTGAILLPWGKFLSDVWDLAIWFAIGWAAILFFRKMASRKDQA